MVTLAARLPAEESAALEAAKHLRIKRTPLKVIEGGRAVQTTPKRLRSRIRVNRDSIWNAPAGHIKCPNPTCGVPIPLAEVEDDYAVCSKGHAHSPREEAERFESQTPGGYTHAGLSLTAMGLLGEDIIERQVRLGRFGKIIERTPYHHPIDFVTDLGFGLESKTVNAVNLNHAFNLSAAEKEAKTAYVLENGLVPAAGLVVVCFRTSRAEIHLRSWPDRFKYFERPKRRPPDMVVKFKNPFVKKARSLDVLPF
ncbi:MAG TPA: hypothetical protein VLF21_00250 [Candidatus Saccharimonadales bacterium]|nr:hypothetical protein [Candidatus Saccharimonadales bacterium]